MFDAIFLLTDFGVNPSLVPGGNLSYSPGNHGAVDGLTYALGDLCDLLLSEVGVHG
jgi:hypothetical protein